MKAAAEFTNASDGRLLAFAEAVSKESRYGDLQQSCNDEFARLVQEFDDAVSS
jgi:hypothetical protein